MFPGWERCDLFNQFFCPVRIRHPNVSGCKHISHCIQTRYFVITFARCELLHRNSHRPQLKNKGRTCRLGLNDQRVHFPFLELFHRPLFEFWKLHAFLERIEQDDICTRNTPVIVLIEHTPRRTRRVVSPFRL